MGRDLPEKCGELTRLRQSRDALLQSVSNLGASLDVLADATQSDGAAGGVMPRLHGEEHPGHPAVGSHDPVIQLGGCLACQGALDGASDAGAFVRAHQFEMGGQRYFEAIGGSPMDGMHSLRPLS